MQTFHPYKEFNKTAEGIGNRRVEYTQEFSICRAGGKR